MLTSVSASKAGIFGRVSTLLGIKKGRMEESRTLGIFKMVCLDEVSQDFEDLLMRKVI